ncbi:hypothetical protein SBC1_49090 (plasmid) [Caballeronia sp. SBC1]|uniref:hypothetical protein n=1 Tax=unclassified Caballeronia TaxID=2646786 RepID=UPI0013E1C706|nr:MULTISPECIES: hypothetical protein [unclassified Caballeronia]QIE25818.1 hypothetical protein SBC2_38880 [Caballeronia sp. SBC2]QIN64869.1 hypothetical protein SBC1_49090 [Caballeronia sp. SBC1]
MSVGDRRQQDLSHIERMIGELERQTPCEGGVTERSPVTRPEYWQDRIRGLVTSSDTTASTIKHAAVLLERLTRLSEKLAQRDGPDQGK